MESLGAQGEWTSLSGMYTAEEEDFMAQLLGNFSVPNELNGVLSKGTSQTSWPGHELTTNMEGHYEGPHYSLVVTNSSLYSFSQGSSKYSDGNNILCPTLSNENYCLSDPHPTSIDFGTGDVPNTNSRLIKGDDCSNHGRSDGNREESSADMPEAVIPGLNLQLGKQYDMTMSEPATKEKISPSSKTLKRSRSSENVTTLLCFCFFLLTVV